MLHIARGALVRKPHISTIVDRMGAHLLPAEREDAEEDHGEQIQEVKAD